MNLSLILDTKFITLIFIAITVVIVGNILKKDKDRKYLKMREKHAVLNIRENTLKKKIELSVEKKAKLGKKFKIESMCIQAGLNMTYGEFKMISIGTAIVLVLLSLMVFNNIFLAIVLFFVGDLLPQQFIAYLRGRRLLLMENQIGSFLNIVTERYKSQRDMPKAIMDSLLDFRGQEPLYSELKTTVSDINLGLSPIEALEGLGHRTDNKYLKRFKDYFAITSQIGTDDARENILGQAFIQFDENRKMKSLLKKEIAGPVNDCYVLIVAIPVMIAYQSVSSDTYVDFMINTLTGKIATAGVLVVVLLAVWFVNAKLGGPLE